MTDEELVKDFIVINTSSTASGPPSPTGEGFREGYIQKKRSELTAFLGFIPINTVLFDCKCFAVGNVNVTGIDSPMGFEADRQSVGGNIHTALVKLLLYFESE